MKNNFYYQSGLCMGLLLGSANSKQRSSVVSRYKSFIDKHGGPDRFKTPSEAVNQFLNTKGKRYVSR